jgi:pullulanase/glycogen debranching enzyme
VDGISENPNNNDSAPTDNDLLRTRLALAILMMSVGIPMITAGQDFLFSKYGVSNTYNQGDLNAIGHGLLETNHNIDNYFKNFIK